MKPKIDIMRTFAKVISTTLFILSIIGCNNSGTTGNANDLKPEDIIRKNAEEYLKKSLNDPSSYEFVSLKAFDTVRYKKNIDEDKSEVNRDIDYAKDQIKFYTEMSFSKKDIEQFKHDLIKKTAILKGIDSIEISMGSKVNDIAALIYIYSFRAKNAFGALVLNDYYLEITSGPDYKILNIAENSDKLSVEPNGFPGQRELYSRYK
jgi:hypothetical protein